MKPDEIRILVIEDNPNWVNKTRQILRHLGYANVRTSANAEEARATFKEFDPHLAVVDIMLPEDEDGFDLIKEMRIAFCAQTAEMYPVSDNVRGHENTEWSQSYAYHLTDAKKDLPRVLLVGDSVCRAYAGGVGKILDGKMNVTFWVSSYCVTSTNYMRLLSVMLDEAKYDVVHFNNTLHSLQTKTADWERAFEAALSLVREKQPDAKIVWCAGTPLRNAAKTRKAAELNAAGARVVAKLGGIATNDLFRLLDPLDRKSAWRDDYHFTAGTSADIARRVADCVLEAAGLAPRCVSGGIRPVTGESPRKPQERH